MKTFKATSFTLILMFLSAYAVAYDKSELLLSGQGVHSELQLNYYLAQLYVSTPQPQNEHSAGTSSASVSTPQTATNGLTGKDHDTIDARRMELVVLVDEWSTRRFARHWNQAILINNSDEQRQQQAANIGMFTQDILRSHLIKGDRLRIDRLPGKGTHITLNGVTLMKSRSEALFNLLLQSWIGARPPSSEFKLALLGKSTVDNASVEANSVPVFSEAMLDALTPTEMRVSNIRRWISNSAAKKKHKVASNTPKSSSSSTKTIVAEKANKSTSETQSPNDKLLSAASQPVAGSKTETEIESQTETEIETKTEIEYKTSLTSTIASTGTGTAHESVEKISIADPKVTQNSSAKQSSAKPEKLDTPGAQASNNGADSEGTSADGDKKGDYAGIEKTATVTIINESDSDSANEEQPLQTDPADSVTNNVSKKDGPNTVAEINTVTFDEVAAKAIDTSVEENARAGMDSNDEPDNHGLLKIYKSNILAKTYQNLIYPTAAIDRGYEGQVIVNVTLNRRGKVKQVEFEKASQHNLLNKAASKAIARASPFPDVPKKIKGNTVVMSLPITFSLGR